MYPTLFKLPFLPDWLADVKSYGVMMMIGFLTGIWIACRRAYRSRANPDIVLNIGFLSLIFGIIGARVMFVLHYWNTRFANQSNPLMAAFDIRAGGLEFWGGPLLVIPVVILYLRFLKKASVRWYLDIMAPALAWGLAVTRMGCFLNGCCWGGVCVDQHDPTRQAAAIPWAVHFPYGSPAMIQQYQFGQLTLPRELIYVLPSGESYPLPLSSIQTTVKDHGKTRQRLLALIKKKHEDAARAVAQFNASPIGLVESQCRTYGMTPAELAQLAEHFRSKPVHPSQLYSVINGFIICWLISAIYYYRKRHGIVLGWFLILYSIARIFLEAIRQDNPLDISGLTISQIISILTCTAGVCWLWLMHAKMPLFSPRAIPFVMADEETTPVKNNKKKSSHRSK